MQGLQKIEIELELRGVSFADLLKMCAVWVTIQRRWLSSDCYATCYGGTDGVHAGRTPGVLSWPEDTSIDALRRCGEERGKAKRIEQQQSAYLTVWFAVWR